MPFGLYLHFPFCRNRCDYCDFYKELHDAETEVRFFEALGIETQLAAQECTDDREISTIYVGGGTPSLTNLRLFGDWLEQLRREFYVPRHIEFSFECNPDSVTLELLETLASFGVNRPVYGVQSFHPSLLKLLGRTHRLENSHRAVYWTNALGYDNFGTDLIFGLPKQRAKMLTTDLQEMADLAPPHISFYQLTVEPGTPLAWKIDNHKIKPPDPELMHGFYRAGIDFLTEAGYQHYEVSSFAKPGYECRHNIGYWIGADYLGLGPSAHSFKDGRRFANTRNLAEYIESLSTSGHRPLVVDESGTQQRIVEAIMLGLRMRIGIDRADFERRFGRKLEDELRRDQFELLVESGHLVSEDGHLRLSDDGFLLADEITGRLV